MTQSEVVIAMSMLSFASISMTIGNKLLMTDTLLAQNSSTVIVLQNLLSVSLMACLMLVGVVNIRPMTRRQLLYFLWDAFVLALQMWTSFEALRHLSVSAMSVCRALAIPAVAWLERLVLGSTLDLRCHACGWLVVFGAIMHAQPD